MTQTKPMHEKLRQYIEINKVSRKLISENSGFDESKLSQMLNGKRRITVDDYVNLCKAMAVDPKRFYEN